jgi:alkaline phosphatase D
MQTRRQFVAGAGSTALAAVAAPQALAAGLTTARSAALYPGVRFDQGVMAGDPTPSGITLLTHAGHVGGAGSLKVEVARDKHFAKVVAHEAIRTSDALGHMVKARVTGLKAGEEYFYRFDARHGHSPVGRFRTAPAPGSKEKLRFAMVSCQEYTFGYYNAHALLAKEKDLDFVLQLGDYIYADFSFSPPLGVRSTPGLGLITTLEDFRAKYGTYRSDPHLQAAQASTGWVNLWDDHEVQNNYAGGDPAGGETTAPFDPQRKVNGYHAFFEQLPTYAYGARNRVYHRAGFGGLMDLFVLDERQYRSRQPCGQDEVPSCPDANNPSLQFLGAAQETFVQGGLKKSKARWKVIANEVQIMRRLEYNGNSGVDDRDAWGGYLAEREALLQVVKDVPGTVFCTGDIHEFIAGTVRTVDGTPAAPEICGSSITSASTTEFNSFQGKPGWGTLDAPTEPADVTAGRLKSNPEWAYLDADHHGYVICEVTASEFKATMKRLQTIRSPTTALLSPVVATVTHGSPVLSIA